MRKIIDVKKVYITSEVADKLGISSSYLIRVAKKLKLSDSEMREAGKRNYLFNDEAIEKIINSFSKESVGK